jgi:hypothetical protein
MNYSSEPLPESEAIPPARLRKKRSFLPSLSNDERSEFIRSLARRAEPTFDYFLFSLLAGAVLAAGWLFHAQALFVVGALLVPFMAPVVGLSLSSAIGAVRFFFVSLAGLLVGIFLIFLTGLIAGLASPIFSPYTLDAYYRSGFLPWDTLLAYLIGIGLTCLSLIKSEQTPSLPSAILSYALLTRASAAGYELGRGHIESALWQAEVMGILILAGIVVGMFLFWAFAFRPAAGSAYVLAACWTVVLAVVVWRVAYPAMLQPIPTSLANAGKPTPTLSLTATPTPTQAPTVTATPAPATASPTLPAGTSTPEPAGKVTATIASHSATPADDDFVWALVASDSQNGGRLRDKPSFSGKVIRILDNKLLVRLLPDTELHDKVYWAHVQTIDGTIGWMVHTVLATATPLPTVTSTPKP